MYMNMFLDGLPDEDFRGWKYTESCHCQRCIDFYQAAFLILSDEYLDEITPST